MGRTSMRSTRFAIAFVVAAAIQLTGCIDVFPQFVIFPHSQFVTIADMNLRAGQADDSAIVARLPKGTVVKPIGQSGSECDSCWRVITPQGIGWVYTYFLTPLPITD
jgi:hypothetical protein